MANVSKEAIRQLTAYKPLFEGAVGRSLSVEALDDAIEGRVMNFIGATRETDFTVVFDWQAWMAAEGLTAETIANPDVLEGADVENLRKILTANLRITRFDDGHLAKIIDSGFLSAFLGKLETFAE